MKRIIALLFLLNALLLCVCADETRLDECRTENCGLLQCTTSFHMGISPTSYPAYTPDFSTGYAIDGSNYVVCPGCLMRIKDIASYTLSCLNGASGVRFADLVAWTFSGSTQIGQSHNDLGPAQSVKRTDIIRAYGNAPGFNIYGASPGNSMDVYNFANPGSYAVYLDFINAICGTHPGSTVPYACPYLAGDPDNKLCAKWKDMKVCDGPWNCWIETQWTYYEGWIPQKQFNIIVIHPSISVAAPTDVTLDRGSSVTKSWTVTNNGVGKVSVSSVPSCGTFSCSFTGYTSGSSIILDAGQTYTFVLNINALASSVSGNAGLAITYDDGYGLSCNAPTSVNSFIVVTVPGTPIPTTTPTTTLPCTVSGLVTTNSGSGIAGVGIDLCNGNSATTDSTGYFSKTLTCGSGYCARITSGLPSGYTAIKGTNNNACHPNAGTYEWQIVGSNQFIDCSYSDQRSWDLSSDNQINFVVDYPIASSKNCGEEGCTASTPCLSGVCSYGTCCSTGQCGWGSENGNPPMCIPDGENKANMWLTGVCRCGKWKTVLYGIGCDNFECDSGTCVSNTCVPGGTSTTNCGGRRVPGRRAVTELVVILENVGGVLGFVSRMGALKRICGLMVSAGAVPGMLCRAGLAVTLSDAT